MQAVPTHTIFSVYDILELICGYVEYSDLTSLLTVSRAFFHCASPDVWRELSDAQPLIKLLPDLNWNNEDPQLDITEQPDELSLSRFDVYASLVQKATVFLGSGWKPFFSIAVHRPPLPKLRELALDPGTDQGAQAIRAVDVCACAIAFLCPSLTKICAPGDYDLWLEPSLASLLLKSIADAAKNLEALHIFVRDQKNVSYTKSLVFADIARFRSLRTLECSGAMVDSTTLQLLGALPQLESLRIEAPVDFDGGLENQELSLDALALPPPSFPTLKHLSLQYLPCLPISQLWHCAPLVQQLVSVDVTLEFDFGLDSLISDMVCRICKGSPRIVELSLDLNEIDADLSLAVVDCLQQLPLQRLQLLNVRRPQLLDDLQPFVLAVANVEYLDIQDMATSFDDLILFAKHLPKMQFLFSNLILTGWSPILQPGLITPSPSTLQLGFRFWFSEEFQEDDLDQDQTMEAYLDIMARNLHRLWPNGVICGVNSHETPREDSDNIYLEFLNSSLKALSPSAGLKLPPYGDGQESWLYKSSVHMF